MGCGEEAVAVKPLQDKARDALAEINDVTAHLAELHKHYAELLEQIKQQEKGDDDSGRAMCSVQPLPRVHVDELPYERFIQEFALPGIPFILEGCSERGQWPAAELWPDINYFLQHPAVNLEQQVNLVTTATPGPTKSDEFTVPMKLGEALRLLLLRRETPQDDAVYIKTWDYVHGGSGELQADIGVPGLFDRAGPELAEQPVLGHSARSMKWLYIGEPGSRSTTHVDTNLSAAWLWLAHGEKDWVAVHGDDLSLFQMESESGAEGKKLPDLFDAELAGVPAAARVYTGVQYAGDIMYNPSRCLHAVHNRTHTVSLTHNYVDGTNLPWVLEDAVRSFSEDMLPSLRGLGSKAANEAMRDLAAGLDMPVDTVITKLDELCCFLSDEPQARERVVDDAAQGSEEARDVLQEYLSVHLPVPALQLVELLHELLSLIHEGDDSSSSSESLEFEYDSSD